jgi:mRNA interferase HigB
VRVISKSRLRQFWESPGCEDSAGPLQAWYTHVSNRHVAWSNWADVKAAFATASLVGNCVVFNIGGNKYRLVTRVLYPSHKVFILRVMTHKQYDDENWKEECGCHQPPPQKASPPRKARIRKSTRRQGKGT